MHAHGEDALIDFFYTMASAFHHALNDFMSSLSILNEIIQTRQVQLIYFPHRVHANSSITSTRRRTNKLHGSSLDDIIRTAVTDSLLSSSSKHHFRHTMKYCRARKKEHRILKIASTRIGEGLV